MSRSRLELDCGRVELPQHIADAYDAIPRRRGFVTDWDGNGKLREFPDWDAPEGVRLNAWERRQNQRMTDWYMAGSVGEFQLEDYRA